MLIESREGNFNRCLSTLFLVRFVLACNLIRPLYLGCRYFVVGRTLLTVFLRLVFAGNSVVCNLARLVYIRSRVAWAGFPVFTTAERLCPDANVIIEPTRGFIYIYYWPTI